MQYRYVACLAILGLSLVWTNGCGRSGRPKVDTVNVSGTVQFDGKPLEGAEVNFVNTDYAGIATTDAAGKYTLTAQPGENKVYIRKYEGAYDPTMTGSDSRGSKSGPKQLLPAKYSDANKTELKLTVPDEDIDNADFKLAR